MAAVNAKSLQNLPVTGTISNKWEARKEKEKLYVLSSCLTFVKAWLKITHTHTMPIIF